MEFKDKIAVVTGAARGIGLAVCQALVAEGCKVVIVDINADAAEAAAEAIRQSGGQALALACDVAVDAQVEAVGLAVKQRFGDADILINNAVAHPLAPGNIDDIDMARWTQALNINVLGYVRMLKAFVPAMLARGSGYVVTTSSSLAILPNAATRHMLPYITSKGAALGLSYGLSHALRARGVLSSVFCPGLTDTSGTGSTKVKAMGFMEGLSAKLVEPATPAWVAQVLLDGMRRGDALICSHEDWEDSLELFAQNRLDPLSAFQ
jgi:NAD(P)-dependent dehydrogenase (short-subunit alcohol dehydrogenase family)